MTARLKGVIVTFESDIREDDAQAIIGAIEMIKGVLSVENSVRNHDDIMNRARVRDEIHARLWKAFQEESET